MHLLLIGPGPGADAGLGDDLKARGATFEPAGDARTGLGLATSHRYDAVVFDLRLPGMTGLEFCRRLRECDRGEVPLVLLAGSEEACDRIAALGAGADECLVHPVAPAELHARLVALTRRRAAATEVLMVGDLIFDLRRLEARRGVRRLDLKRVALTLLEALMRASPGVLRKDAATRSIWGDRVPENGACLRGHIHTLRRLIDDGEPVKLLHTLHGVGYRLSVAEEVAVPASPEPGTRTEPGAAAGDSSCNGVSPPSVAAFNGFSATRPAAVTAQDGSTRPGS